MVGTSVRRPLLAPSAVPAISPSLATSTATTMETSVCTANRRGSSTFVFQPHRRRRRRRVLVREPWRSADRRGLNQDGVDSPAVYRPLNTVLSPLHQHSGRCRRASTVGVGTWLPIAGIWSSRVSWILWRADAWWSPLLAMRVRVNAVRALLVTDERRPGL